MQEIRIQEIANEIIAAVSVCQPAVLYAIGCGLREKATREDERLDTERNAKVQTLRECGIEDAESRVEALEKPSVVMVALGDLLKKTAKARGYNGQTRAGRRKA